MKVEEFKERLRDVMRCVMRVGYYAGRAAAGEDVMQLLDRLEKRQRMTEDGWVAGYNYAIMDMRREMQERGGSSW